MSSIKAKIQQKIQRIRKYGAQKSGTAIFEGREPKLMTSGRAQARLSHLRPLRAKAMNIRGKFTSPQTVRLVKTATPRGRGPTETVRAKLKRRVQGVTRGQTVLRK